MSDSSDWWRTFFSGLAVDVWLKATSPEQTQQEADFILESLDVPAPAKILDVPCGGGRHSDALAGRGYDMTAVDISTDFLKAASTKPVDRPGKVDWQEREMRDLPWPATFDGAFCFGNSFGYLDDEGNAAFLTSVATTLKPGARFVLETNYLTEGVLPVLQERSWYPIGDMHMLAHRHYDPVEGRLYVDYIFIRGGETQTRSMSARLYTFREMIRLLEAAGFTDVKAYSSLTHDPFRQGSNRLLAIATKPKG
jgi:SAM-dependent methyltransferase